MTISFYGEVLEKDFNTVKILDYGTKQTIVAQMKGTQILDIEVEQTGIFTGQMLGDGSYQLKRIDPGKLLTPLWEEDLFEASGKYTLVTCIKNPFTEAFLQRRERLYKDSYAQKLINSRDENDTQSS
jgi:hypothetical protein